MAKETKDNQRILNRIATQEAAKQKRIETAARVQANAKRKQTAKEAKLVKSNKKRAKKESNMDLLREIQSQAAINRANAIPISAPAAEGSSSAIINTSIDPSLM
jgi:hypothetical protein